MAHDAGASLTTGQLAELTGMPAGTLRMWEARYGFPSPVRRPGGHHRYHVRDVEIVREVLRLRGHGLSIAAAIERARTADEDRPASVFAGLRDARPELMPIVLTKRALLALTRAVEDEYCARAGGGLLIASFQRERFYRQSERRWRELARTAEFACALADFDVLRRPRGAPAEIPVSREHPLAREWTLVVNAPSGRACLAAWEQPSEAELPDGLRRFEVVWSFEPQVVQTATAVAVGLVRSFAPELIPRLPPVGEPALAGSLAELRFASGLTHRMLGYLAAQV
jgi:MerR family transcriptional regulator, light-induced transcriptional regulator